MKQVIQKVLTFFCFVILLTSCNRTPPTNDTDKLYTNVNSKIDLANKVYFIGPVIDSVSSKIQAECDCCASDLLFFGDSTFVLISYCEGSDTYSKGAYSVRVNKLLLYYDPLRVTKSDDFESETDTSKVMKAYTSYEISRSPSIVPIVQISFLKSKPFLSLKYKEGTDYGMENDSISFQKFVKNLKSDSVWIKLNLK